MEKISKEKWRETHRDYKAVIKGQTYILKMTVNGTSLVPVEICNHSDGEDKVDKVEKKLKKMAGF